MIRNNSSSLELKQSLHVPTIESVKRFLGEKKPSVKEEKKETSLKKEKKETGLKEEVLIPGWNYFFFLITSTLDLHCMLLH